MAQQDSFVKWLLGVSSAIVVMILSAICGVRSWCMVYGRNRRRGIAHGYGWHNVSGTYAARLMWARQSGVWGYSTIRLWAKSAGTWK